MDSVNNLSPIGSRYSRTKEEINKYYIEYHLRLLGLRKN